MLRSGARGNYFRVGGANQVNWALLFDVGCYKGYNHADMLPYLL